MKIKIAVILCTAMVLSSCDPVVSYDKIIRNSSDQDLILLINQVSEETPLIDDRTLLESKEDIRIAEGFDIGGSVEAFEDCPGYPLEGDEIIIGVLKDDQVDELVRITSKTEWRYKVTSRDRSGAGLCKCIFEITDEMLNQ